MTIKTIWNQPSKAFIMLTPERITTGNGAKWFAASATHAKPKLFTPTAAFVFGGREFKALYPCVAFATINFGFIAQNFCGKITIARE